MTQRCLKVLTRSLLGLVALVTTAGVTALSAQSTGKIEGHVQNVQSQPIVGATVSVPGTAFSATTNAQGYYFIENLPVGTTSVLAKFIGYSSLLQESVRVQGGNTLTLNFQLEARPVTLADITVTVQTKQALVPRDQVTSRQGFTGDNATKLPVDRIGQLLALQPGVAQVSNCSSNSPCTPLISVRGGRVDQNNTYVDGVPVSNAVHTGTGAIGSASNMTGASILGNSAPQLQIATNGFEEASVTTGASDASQGNAQGGIINIATKTGGSKFTGSLGVETGLLGLAYYGQGFNTFKGSIGGPITKRLTFFASGEVDGNNSTNGGNHGWLFPGYSRVGIDTTYTIAKGGAAGAAATDSVSIPVYKYAVTEGGCDSYQNASDPGIASNYGVTCHANQSYASPTTSYFTSDKLNYTFGQGSRIALSYNYSGQQSAGVIGDGSTQGNIQGANLASLNWTQTLLRSSTHQITLDATAARRWSNTITGRLTDASQQSAENNSPLGIITKKLSFQYGKKDFPLDSTLLYNVLLNKSGHRIGLTDAFNSGQYGGVAGFNTALPQDGVGYAAGGNGNSDIGLSYGYENSWYGRLDFDIQADRYNRLKVGGEYNSYDLGAFQGNTTGNNDYTGKPVVYDAYAEDRIDLGDVVVVGGIRYDYYSTKAWRWNEYPEISTRPGFTPDSLFCAPGATPNYKAKCALVQDPSHNYLSPHVQVSFPVTDATNFRLSYSQAVQAPDFGLIYNNALTDINTGGVNSRSRWGQDLDFGKTVKFEFGARHAFNEDMVLDVAVYNNDDVANPSYSFQHPIDPVTGNASILYLAENTDFGNTRGIDVRLDRRIGNYFNGSLSYSYQDAKDTGTDPTSYLGFFEPLSGFTGTPPTAALTTGTSRPQSITGIFNVSLPGDWNKGNLAGTILHNTSLYVTGRLASGTPYTRCDPSSAADYLTTSGSSCTSILALSSDYNGARLPALKQLDLRLTRNFHIGKYLTTAYVDARNVLNLTNVVSVYAQTGTTTNLKATQQRYSNDSLQFKTYASDVGEYRDADGAITLPSTIAGCGKVANGSNSFAPECFYYFRSEQRFGNGDHVYTLAEQRAASDSKNAFANSIWSFVTGARTIRFGLEVNF
ncbi:MAG TPA: TonB-dependent receptor [Gemmatimonadales bacterium]|jgi:hypothetical protein